MSDASTEAQGQGPRPHRAPRHVRAAAKMLQKEARVILKKHAARIAEPVAEQLRASLAAADTHRRDQNWGELEVEAERIDELLHEHCSFARKSAIRETAENVAMAILAALALRSCIYEPFTIPSGSMAPTLYAGDFIFVSKFAYGIQVPFTNTVVGQWMGEVERGDVVVFRYPLDESEDYIKRVVGTPGDKVKVVGTDMWIQRAGTTEFSPVVHALVDEPCRSERGEAIEGSCRVFDETLDGNTHRIQHVGNAMRGAEARVWTVPEGHYLVRGDNRDASADSLHWRVSTEAVEADGVLTPRDLRDILGKGRFSSKRPLDAHPENVEHDRIQYLGDHKSEAHDVSLDVWRHPTVGLPVLAGSLRLDLDGAKPTTMDALVAEAKLPRRVLNRALETGRRIDGLWVARGKTKVEAIAVIEPLEVAVHLRCGRAICTNDGALAERLSQVTYELFRDPAAHARELLPKEPTVDQVQREHPRKDGQGGGARRFSKGSGDRNTVTLEVFRGRDVPHDIVRRAILDGSGRPSEPLESATVEGRLIQEEEAWGLWAKPRDPSDATTVYLRCGKSRCRNLGAARELAEQVLTRMSEDPTAPWLRALDVPGYDLDESFVAGFERVTRTARMRGPSHSVGVEVWRKPEDGVDATVARARQMDGVVLPPRPAVGPEAYLGRITTGFAGVAYIPATETIVRMTCTDALCDETSAERLLRRAVERTEDEDNFVDPEALRPQPFVPRGHIKGRADRIWLPFSRFWLRIE